jgi:glycosyltransferase involved in cell wall biosynthesis
MRILYCCAQSTVSGGVRILAEHLNRLTARGHYAAYVTLQPSPLDWLPTLFPQGTLDHPPAPLDSFDVVVATAISTWKEVAESEKFGKAKRKCFVQMLDHLFFPEGSEAYQKYLEFYALPLEPIVISGWLMAEMLKHNPRLARLIVNGLDLNLFYPDPLPGHDRNGRWPPRLLIEGWSHSPAKDIDEMAYRAIEYLRGEGIQFEVWGFSQYAPRFEMDNFWRLPDQDTIRRIYSSCDLLFKASRYEGRPGPDAEAMACGCVVNRAILKGDDYLYDGENCLKVAYGDQEGFNQNALRLLTDPLLVEQLRANGLAYVREHMNWDNIIPMLEKALAA